MSKSIDFKISLDHDNLLISRGNKSFIVKGHYIDDLVGVILESNIKAFKKSDNFKDLIIEYDNNQGQIILQNYNLLFKYAEFSQVKKQYETYKNNNLNKITKTNKHVGKRIAITATLVTILSLTALNSTKANELKKPDVMEPIINQEISINEINTIVKPNLSQNIPVSENQINVLLNNDENKKVKVSNNEIKKTLNLEFVDNSDSKKVNSVENNYENTIKKYAQKYGFDYNLILAICTQERGTHSTISDDTGGLGIMQIQVSAHEDGSQIPTTIFNELNEPMESTFTFNQDKYKTLDGNIEAGCALLRYYTNLFNGNIVAGIYAYNTGEGNIGKTVNSYANDLGITKDAVLSDINHNYWAKYLSDDQYKYLPMVMQYYKGNELSYYVVNKDANNKVKATKTSLEINNILSEEAKKTR